MTQKRIEIINNNNNNNIETNNNININNNENISPETNEEITFNSNSVSNSIPSNSNSNNLILNLNNDIIQLYIGLQVDILDSVNYWTEAEIIKIDLENKKIFITYLYWSSRWDEWIDINSGRVAPLHTHTYNPPNPLQLRQRIEVLRYSEWREAFVVEQSLTQVKVHYRNIPFQYDEWIDRNSQRIRKFGHSKTIKKNKKWSVPVISNSSNNKMSNNNDENYDYNNSNNNSNANNNLNNNNNDNNNNLHTRQIIQSSDRYNHYIQGLQRFKLEVYGVSGDGNCLFRSVSHQIYGDDSYHLLVREKCMDYMEVNSSFFSQFVIGGMDSFPTYLRVKRMNGCWGDDPEIQAMCEIYDQSAQIWAYDSNSGARCLRTFHEITSSRPTTAPSVSSASTSLATTNTLSPPTTPNNNSHNANNNNNSTTSNTNTPWWRMGNSNNNSNNNSITQKNPIRLSYYGGGHYDSLIYSRNNNNNNNQSSERRVYPRPGEIEDRAISRAKERVRLGLNSHLHTEEAKQSTDIDATEMAELELALEVSRNNLTEWEDDIDACLLLSTQETSLNGLEEFKDSSDLPPQLIETQQQMFQTVVEQSEREYIEKALEESIKTATSQNIHQINNSGNSSNNDNDGNNNNSNNNNDDDVDLDITEAELMESVYQESLKVSPTSTTTTSFPNSLPPATISSNFTTSIDPDVKLALELSELNEDELLQRALQESLNNNNNNNNTTNNTTTTNNNNNNNNQQYQPQQSRLNTNTNNLSEEEQLQEAIRMSMMNQFQSNELYSHNMIPDDVDPELEMAIQASYHDFHR